MPGKSRHGKTEEIIRGDNLAEYYGLETEVIDNEGFQCIVFSGRSIKLVF
jgi:ABC-type cobalamin/Fe3+-siderophores transport system ATPase subunit